MKHNLTVQNYIFYFTYFWINVKLIFDLMKSKSYEMAAAEKSIYLS